MATTELHKVPETILSRCQEFEFRTIPLQKIFDRLKLIAEAEKIDISDDALRELARSGEGSMRDAQSNFDQVISFSSDNISAADVTNALGFAGVEILTKTLNAIAGREPRLVLAVVDDIIGRGHDLRNFCRDLLGLFRDLLVFKVAGGDKHLFEGAVFSEDELRVMAEAFTEPDLLRFFNALCATEASLREAAHPRYVLEIGLVKLIEMRSVATIENILERLDALSSGVPQKSEPGAVATGFHQSATASSDSALEKKTLKIEPEPIADFGSPIVDSNSTYQISNLKSQIDELVSVVDVKSQSADTNPTIADIEPQITTSFLQSAIRSPQSDFPSVRLPTLSSAELEHVDDKRLDEGYEEKLWLTGDDLLPIKGVDKIIETFLGVRPVSATVSNGSAAAAAPAFDIAKIRDEIAPKQEAVELPVLSSDPTEAELLEYANAHPSIRAAKRIFRAKIVEVKKA